MASNDPKDILVLTKQDVCEQRADATALHSGRTRRLAAIAKLRDRVKNIASSGMYEA